MLRTRFCERFGIEAPIVVATENRIRAGADAAMGYPRRRRRRAQRARGPQPPFAAFGQCVGAADVARPPTDFRPPEVGAGDGGKGLDGTTGGLEKLPA